MEGGNWILLKEWKTCRDVVTDNAPQKTNISHCVEWDSKSYRFWKCRTWKYNHFRRWGKSLTITAGDNVNIYKKYTLPKVTLILCLSPQFRYPALGIRLYTHTHTHTHTQNGRSFKFKDTRKTGMKEISYRKRGFSENPQTTRQWQLRPFYLNVFSKFLQQVHLFFNSRVADSFLERLKNQGRKITGNFVLSMGDSIWKVGKFRIFLQWGPPVNMP